jgi:hypothetical protein
MTAQTDSRSRDVQTERLLTAPILPVMLSLAGPTLLVMLSQTFVGLMEVWFLSQLGEDVLAGVSVVFPLLALTTALATGAVGGGMLGAVARALGRNDRVQANALVWHAVAIAVAFGLVTAGLVLAFGTVAFSAMGASGEALRHADHYAAVVFGGAPLIWLFNALLAVIRGSGNVRLPMRVVCGGGVILIPVSWLLIFGAAGFRGLGVTGGALAMVLYYAVGSLVFAIYLWRGQGVLQPAARPVRLQRRLFADILKVGGVSALIATSTNLTIRIRRGCAIGILVGAAQFRHRRACCDPDWHQRGGRQDRSRTPRRVDRSLSGVRRCRDYWVGGCDMARVMAGRVFDGPRKCGDGKRLPAPCWPLFWLLWAWFHPVLRRARHRQDGSPVGGRLGAHGGGVGWGADRHHADRAVRQRGLGYGGFWGGGALCAAARLPETGITKDGFRRQNGATKGADFCQQRGCRPRAGLS